jgi:hypothetical protein
MGVRLVDDAGILGPMFGELGVSEATEKWARVIKFAGIKAD